MGSSIKKSVAGLTLFRPMLYRGWTRSWNKTKKLYTTTAANFTEHIFSVANNKNHNKLNKRNRCLVTSVTSTERPSGNWRPWMGRQKNLSALQSANLRATPRTTWILLLLCDRRGVRGATPRQNHTAESLTTNHLDSQMNDKWRISNNGDGCSIDCRANTFSPDGLAIRDNAGTVGGW